MTTQHEEHLSYDAIFQVEGYRRTFEQEQEPILQECFSCGGYHADVEACPLARRRSAIVIAWQSPLMPVPAYEVYHEACAPLMRVIPGCEVEQRKVDVREIARLATCAKCGEYLSSNDDEQAMYDAHIIP